MLARFCMICLLWVDDFLRGSFVMWDSGRLVFHELGGQQPTEVPAVLAGWFRCHLQSGGES